MSRTWGARALSALAIAGLCGSAFAQQPPKPTLNGNLSDFNTLVTQINAGMFDASAANQLDNINNGVPVGTDGFQDEPLQDDATPQLRFMRSPINVGNFYIIYAPDSDGVVEPAGQDNSYLAIGVNIANGDGDVFDFSVNPNSPPDLPANRMVLFDADGNGNPCVLGLGAGSRWAPSDPVLTFDEANDAVTLDFFLCADDVGDLAGADFSVVYQQRNQLNTELVVDGLSAATFDVFPPVNSTCAQIAARGTDNITAFPDGRGNDDLEIIINRIDGQVLALPQFAGLTYEEVRFRLANLGVTLRSDASADLSNEDSMFTLLELNLPQIEVTKLVKCVGEPDAEFREKLTTPAGGQLEYLIEVENTGNVDLAVDLIDVIEAGLTPVSGSMTVTLFRPGDAAVGMPVNFANAGTFNPQFNLNFFGGLGDQFLMDMVTGTRRCLGTLNGVNACDDPVDSVPGDRVQIRFRANVSPNACGGPDDELSNAITAIGDPDVGGNMMQGPCSSNSNNGNEVTDAANVVDTPRENAGGGDDNVALVNLLCVDSLLVCEETISVDYGDNGSDELVNRTLVTLDSSMLPARLTYRFRVSNEGDVPINDICIRELTNLVSNAVAAGLLVGPCSLDMNGTCSGAGDDAADIASLAAGASASVTCEILLDNDVEFLVFAGLDSDGNDQCYESESQASGTATLESTCGDATQELVSVPCSATVCLTTPPRDCLPTKAKFDIWNENEVRFSGTERCVYSWDQEWLSQYTPIGLANHFHRNALQTDKGKARIDGLRSPVVCTDESIPAPFLGVAAKRLGFHSSDPDFGGPAEGRIETAGTTLVGTGTEVGQIIHDLPAGGDESNLPPDWRNGVRPRITLPPVSQPGVTPGGTPELPGGTNPASASLDPRVDVSTKGSLLLFNKVELKWDASGSLIQDTIITIVNDDTENGTVDVQLYFVNGDLPAEPIYDNSDPPQEIERAHLGCNAVDNIITLTHDESNYWASSTGQPKGVSPFTILDPGVPPGRPDTCPYNPGGRVLRGYILAWAQEHGTGNEIRWNHLSGTGMIINYRDTSAWAYPAWAFQALAGDDPNEDDDTGNLLLAPFGTLDLNGVEYEYAPARLVFDFYAVGAYLWSYNNAVQIGVDVIDTDLTLWAALKDLRAP